MDEVIVKGVKYISSKRASKESGYAKDYIGQMVRSGKLVAVKVGRSWFVDERGLRAHSSATETSHDLTIRTERPLTQYSSRNAALTSVQALAVVQFPKTWQEIKYLDDYSGLYPNSDSRDNQVLIGKTTESSEKIAVRRVNPLRYKAISTPTSAFDGIYMAIPETTQVNSTHVRASRLDTLLRTFVAAILVSAIALLVPILG